MNVICLEGKGGKASKVLFIRQNVTELKEKELHIQAERALANCRERQYQTALMSNSLCSFGINLPGILLSRTCDYTFIIMDEFWGKMATWLEEGILVGNREEGGEAFFAVRRNILLWAGIHIGRIKGKSKRLENK